MAKKRETPNPKRKVVGGPSRDPATGYGMSSRTNASRILGAARARKSISSLKTEDVLNNSTRHQSKRKLETYDNNRRKKK